MGAPQPDHRRSGRRQRRRADRQPDDPAAGHRRPQDDAGRSRVHRRPGRHPRCRLRHQRLCPRGLHLADFAERGLGWGAAQPCWRSEAHSSWGSRCPGRTAIIPAGMASVPGEPASVPEVGRPYPRGWPSRPGYGLRTRRDSFRTPGREAVPPGMVSLPGVWRSNRRGGRPSPRVWPSFVSPIYIDAGDGLVAAGGRACPSGRGLPPIGANLTLQAEKQPGQLGGPVCCGLGESPRRDGRSQRPCG